MAFTIPDKGEGISDRQSILFQEQLNILAAGASGLSYLLSESSTGLSDPGRVEPSTTAGNVKTYSGFYYRIGNTAGLINNPTELTLSAYIDTVDPKFLVICANLASNFSIIAGAASATPVLPAINLAAYAVLAVVYVPPAASPYLFTAQHITDMRMFNQDHQPRGQQDWDGIFYENPATVYNSYTISSGKNAMSAGPITINTGCTITVPTGSVWTIV